MITDPPMTNSSTLLIKKLLCVACIEHTKVRPLDSKPKLSTVDCLVYYSSLLSDWSSLEPVLDVGQLPDLDD